MKEHREKQRGGETSAEEDFAEQERLLRAAYVENKDNALGVLNIEIVTNQKSVDGEHPDDRLKSEKEVARARYFLERYTALKEELEGE